MGHRSRLTTSAIGGEYPEAAVELLHLLDVGTYGNLPLLIQQSL